jgi:hypothetical protein
MVLENKIKAAALAGEILTRQEVLAELNNPSPTQQAVQAAVDFCGTLER